MKNMKKYIIETRLKSQLDLVRDCVMAESKILAHKAMNEKYGSDYCASAILSEETDLPQHRSPVGGKVLHDLRGTAPVIKTKKGVIESGKSVCE